MDRTQHIILGVGCVGLGAMITFSSWGIEWVGLGLIGTGIVQFIRLPKDNVLPFRRNSHGPKRQ